VNHASAKQTMTKQTVLRAILTCTLLFPLGTQGQSASPDPMSLSTRDSHQNLTIVADPYVSALRYKKEIFGKTSPYDAGIVAIDVYFKNDNDLPIRVNPGTMQLVISEPGLDRQRLGALSPEEVADRALLTANSNVSAPRRLPIPIPIPSSGSRSKHTKEWTEMTTALRAVALGTDVLGPHSTTHGFLFFDLNHDFGAIHNSRLYVPDLTFMTTNQALFFFEIDLAGAPTK
jgi:hypothetical protein